MLVSGEEEAVKEMIARCPVGPSAARVQRIEVEESAEEAPAGFESRPTV